MLVLGRKAGEVIKIGDDIRITVVRGGGIVRIGVDAPQELIICREELEPLPERTTEQEKVAC